VNELRVKYGGQQALAGVSLEVNQGQLAALVGANGSGKTTLINAVSGLVRPYGGSIHWREQRIDGLACHEIGRLGLIQVPEGRKLFPRMTVLENLEIGAYAPVARTRRLKSLARVFTLFPTLKERRVQLAGTLSGGEQQMLALGRAIMALPKLLLLDEPTEGLAPKAATTIFDVVRHLNREGLGMLLVSQEVRRSLSLSDNAYCLENGRVVLAGPGPSLLENPLVRESYLGI